MNTEEKAKAYDEALERARKQKYDYQKEFDKTDKNSQLAGILRAGISAIELVFPELAESEDERIRKALVIMMKVPRKEIFEAQGITKEQALAYLEKPKEQQPAEWSEEDEKIMQTMIKDGDLKPSETAWLKSLPERFNLQPKQEWSAEETKDLVHILKVLDDCYAYGKHDLSKTDHDNLTSTLKSLRPLKDCSSCAKHLEGYISGRCAAENKLLEQFGALVTPEGELHIKPRWKPSGEQMGTLNYAYCELFKREGVGHNILGPLQKLLDDLKKLM